MLTKIGRSKKEKGQKGTNDRRRFRHAGSKTRSERRVQVGNEKCKKYFKKHHE